MENTNRVHIYKRYIWLLLLMVIFVIYSVFEVRKFQQSGKILNEKSDFFEQVLTGYAYYSAVNQSEWRVKNNYVGGRNALYVSNEAIYEQAQSKAKTKERATNLFSENHGDLKFCVEKMQLHNASFEYNCVTVLFRGKTDNIVCQLQETQALSNGKHSECGITYHLSSWYKSLDIP